jgi:HEAT repeat protein
MPRLLSGLLAHQRDHRIGVPIPEIAEVPDACTACHKDKSKDWAAAAWRARWGEPPQATLDAVRGIVLARRGEPDATPLLEAGLRHADPFFRANAALYRKDGASLTSDPSPEARLVAVAASAANGDRTYAKEALLRFARDPEARVRAAAALALARRGEPLRDGAEDDLVTEIRQFRLATDARLLLVRVERERGRLGAAAAWLLDALSHDPELATRPGIAAALDAVGRPDEARAVRALGASSRRSGGDPQHGGGEARSAAGTR